MLDLKRNSAADILREVKIATESSLARGEYDLFTNFAKKQKEIEEIRAFSFYGKTGVVELSSEQSRVGQSLEKVLWKQAQTAKGMFELENDQVLSFYYPLRVNQDMRRLRPTWKVGDIYGVLHLEFSKDKIKQMASAARNKYDTSSRWARNVVMLAVMAAVAIASVLSFLLCRAILKPLRVCMLAVKGLAKKDFSHTCQVKSNDEVGQMAQAINETIGSMQSAFNEIEVAGKREKESQQEREQEQQRGVEEERRKADDMHARLIICWTSSAGSPRATTPRRSRSPGRTLWDNLGTACGHSSRKSNRLSNAPRKWPIMNTHMPTNSAAKWITSWRSSAPRPRAT